MVPLRLAPKLIFMATLAAWTAWHPMVDAQQHSGGCLYAITSGPNAIPVSPCINADPLGLGNDPDVRQVMKAFGINPSKVRFRGCSGVRFSASPDPEANGSEQRYVITYPTEAAKTFLAPVTHELAHVHQMEMAGSFQALRTAISSKRIELGADYLTGVVFSQVLPHVELNQFQHNLSLIGLYFELDADAHGTPSERTSAFRMGVYLKFDTVARDIRKASDDFQANVYGKVVSR